MKQLKELNREEFDLYSRNNHGLFYQSAAWAELKGRYGWIHYFLGLEEDGKLIAATLVLGKKTPVLNNYIYYAPRGFLLDYSNLDLFEEFSNEVKKFVKEHQGIFIKINPYVDYQYRDVDGNVIGEGKDKQPLVDKILSLGYKHNGFTMQFGTDLEPRFLSVLDINGRSYSEIEDGIKHKVKNKIRNAYSHGFEMVECDETLIPEYKKLMEHTSERRGFVDRSLSYYQDMYDVFKNDDEIKIVLAKWDLDKYLNILKERKESALVELKELEERNTKAAKSKINEVNKDIENTEKRMSEAQKIKEEHGSPIFVSGGLYLLYGEQMVSLFGASLKPFMKYNAQTFLKAEMIKMACDKNKKVFNFFGMEPNFDVNQKDSGLFEFKKAFGTIPQELIGEFTLVVRPLHNLIYNVMYNLYQKIR